MLLSHPAKCFCTAHSAQLDVWSHWPEPNEVNGLFWVFGCFFFEGGGEVSSALLDQLHVMSNLREKFANKMPTLS